MRVIVFFLASLALSSGAEPKVERGEIKGAGFRIDVPENWNGSLVLVCHGYAMKPPDFSKETTSKGIADIYSRLGFAVAQSAYATAGWAVQDALKDTEALRLHFIEKY